MSWDVHVDSIVSNPRFCLVFLPSGAYETINLQCTVFAASGWFFFGVGDYHKPFNKLYRYTANVDHFVPTDELHTHFETARVYELFQLVGPSLQTTTMKDFYESISSERNCFLCNIQNQKQWHTAKQTLLHCTFLLSLALCDALVKSTISAHAVWQAPL